MPRSDANACVSGSARPMNSGNAHPMLSLCLLLLLAACQLPTPPNPAQATATALVVAVTPSATGTATPMPPSATPAPPTATATATATPTPTITPTPTLPAMRLFTDAQEMVRVRVPRDWAATEESDAERVQLSFNSPDGSSFLFVTVLPAPGDDEAAREAFIESFLANEPDYTRELLPDGTLRLAGTLREGTGRFEMRLHQRPDLIAALIAASDSTLWEGNQRFFEQAFESFHLYAAPAAAHFAPAVATPIADAEALVVRSTHAYTTPGEPDAPWVIGEIENEGDVDLESVAVTVELLAGDGRVVATAEGFSRAELLLAGERAPFVVQFPPLTDTTWVGIRAIPSASPGFSVYHALLHKGLRVADVALEEEASEESVTLVGRVANEGDGAARLLRVDGALYDEAGTLVAVATTFVAPPDSLEPGQSAPFTLVFTQRSGTLDEVAEFRVWVSGHNDGE